jgi:hypothetical protein
VPHDINLDSSTKSASIGGESPKVNEPPTPNIKETASESLKPLSPGGAHSSLGAGGALSLSAQAALSPNLAGASSGPEPVESSKKFPKSPQSYGLGATSGYQPGEGSSMPRPEKQL